MATAVHVDVSYGQTFGAPIHVRADGSVDPSHAPIQRDGNNYVLTGDIFVSENPNWPLGPALSIERNNMTLNGAGHQIYWTYAGNGPVSGIQLEGLSNVTITNVTIVEFEGCIYIRNCSNITVIGNVLNSAGEAYPWKTLGITYPWQTWGLVLDNSSNNTVVDNDVDTTIALWDDSSNNTIFHNNFWENPLGMCYNWQMSVSGHNFWDDGYPSGGNFWGAYSAYLYSSYAHVPRMSISAPEYFGGIDVYSGPYQNETGSDGVVDTPFILGEGNVDHYPLIVPRSKTRISPQAVFYVASKQPCYVTESVVFNATMSTPGWNGSQLMLIKEFNWDFGDGNVTSIPCPTSIVYPTHTYKFPGLFNVTLTAVDAEGINASETETLRVMMPVFVSISTSMASSPPAYKVDITGRLYDVNWNGLKNQIVVFQYTFPGSQGWIPITSAITDHLGAYHIVWTPTATGNFTIEAEWSGNETHFGVSKNFTVILGPASLSFFDTILGRLVAVGTPIAVIMAVIAFYITRRKHRNHQSLAQT
jgi:PKD repeat protein